jgi:hypothetical protein
MSGAGLERRYRRLLWAYPGPYRRRHGAEIVTTLLDMAEAGRGRPSRLQALHLVLCGIRQRFRLPAGRPLAYLAAVLAMVALGAAGSAAGTWLGWQTAASVPSSSEMRALTAATSSFDPGGVPVYPSQSAMKGPVVAAIVSGRMSYSADRLREGLVAAGWRVTMFTETPSGMVVDMSKDPWVQVPMKWLRIDAAKDGLLLHGDSTTVVGGAEYGVEGRTDERIDVWATETAAVRPMTIAGLLAGMLAGWLLTAALAYRVRQGRRGHRAAVVVLGVVGFAAAAVPAFAFFCALYQVMVYDSGVPSPYITDSPSDNLPEGLVPACAGIAVLALVAAVLIAVRGARVEREAAGDVALN